MNNDLISRSALMEKLGQRARKHEYDECTELTIYEDMHEVKNAPAVDAVIPVRCAQCNHFKRNLENDTYCSSVNGLTDPQEDDFCSYGEKRGSEHE